MCGFVAILQESPVVELADARRALDAIEHRGPDAAGEWTEENIFLGHRRLSIIDLSTGDQPMQSIDGRYVIIFNGEIYNFPELRERLAREGAKLRTRSDTEVILEGYACWGPKVVERLHGMFAFVIWDRQRQVLFGARDRVGIKPLCWAIHRNALIVASTLECFSALQFGQIDPTALRDLLTFDYIPVPRTIYQGVHKLEAGSRFEWTLGSGELRVDSYWSPPVVDTSADPPKEAEIESLLERAVKRQMISDVPIGVFLSGGIDSSLMVAMMARHSHRPVRTFAVAFAEKGVDESPIAKIVAQHFNTEHTVLQSEEINAEDLLNLLGRLDEPFCDPAFVPTYSLSHLTRQHVKVALSGDGGDEVFGGYPKYLMGKNHRRALPFGSMLHRGLRAMPWKPRGISHLYWRTLSSQQLIPWSWSGYGDFPVFRKDLRQVLAPSLHEAVQVEQFFEPWERRARKFGRCFDMDVLMRADVETYLSENCLVKTDRASMLASLEVRVPFLDELILDRILPLPAEQKISGGQLKSLLLPIARRLLPREVWDRPKHGFHVPLDARLAGAWRPAVETVLEWGKSRVKLFDYRYLRRLHAINIAEGGIGRELWNPFVFLAWAMARSKS